MMFPTTLPLQKKRCSSHVFSLSVGKEEGTSITFKSIYLKDNNLVDDDIFLFFRVTILLYVFDYWKISY